MKGKAFGCVGIGALLLLFFSVLLNVGLLARFGLGSITSLETGVRRPDPFQELELKPAKSPGTGARIAQIDLDVVISGEGDLVMDIERQLTQAVDDPTVKAVVLRIDSPGGEVTASDTIHRAVKAAAAKKPVVVYMDSVAASGGYYIACGATRIVAHPTGLTGSIGVIMQSYGYADLMGKVGVEARTFKSGAMKDAGAGMRPMTESEREYFQQLVNQSFERFVGIVSEARGLPVDQLKNGIADGRIFHGEEAKAKGLVDENGYLDDAWAAAMRLAKVSDAAVVRYERTVGFRDMLSGFGLAKAHGAGSATKVELDVSERFAPRLKSGVQYYLWTASAE